MKLRTYLVATTAIFTGSTAFGADMPVAPESVEPITYVRACDAYGAGYFQLPGKETCFKLGGRIRAQVVSGNLSDDEGSDYSSYTRGYNWFETHTATGFGHIYTYTGMAYTWADEAEDPGFQADDAFIQFGTDAGTLTFGVLTSLYDGYLGNAWMQIGGANWSEVYPLQATLQIPVGDFTLGLSVEDASYRESNSENINFIGALEYSQALFDVKLSGAVVDETKSPELEFNDDKGTFDPADDLKAKGSVTGDGDYGYAVNLNAAIRPVDNFEISFGAQYGMGAYNFTAQGMGSYEIHELAKANNLPAEYVAMFKDHVVSLFNANEVESFSVMGGFTYDVTEKVSFMLEGSYHQWEVGFNGAVPTGVKTGDVLEFEDVDFDAEGDAFRVSTSIVWKPAPGLGIALAGGYTEATVEGTVNGETATHTKETAKIGTRIQYTF